VSGEDVSGRVDYAYVHKLRNVDISDTNCLNPYNTDYTKSNPYPYGLIGNPHN
ncbi:7933_t:CDS:1, partial [Acaulospora morrowiae]